MKSKTLTVAEAAQRLEVKPITVRILVWTGRLDSTPEGIDPDALERFKSAAARDGFLWPYVLI